MYHCGCYYATFGQREHIDLNQFYFARPGTTGRHETWRMGLGASFVRHLARFRLPGLPMGALPSGIPRQNQQAAQHWDLQRSSGLHPILLMGQGVSSADTSTPWVSYWTASRPAETPGHWGASLPSEGAGASSAARLLPQGTTPGPILVTLDFKALDSITLD